MAEQLITRDYGLLDTPFVQKLREQGRVEGLAAGRVEGLAEGRVEGRAEGRAELVLRLLARQVGELDRATVEQVQQLAEGHLLALADALFGFERVSDLAQWLAAHAAADADAG